MLKQLINKNELKYQDYINLKGIQLFIILYMY